MEFSDNVTKIELNTMKYACCNKNENIIDSPAINKYNRR